MCPEFEEVWHFETPVCVWLLQSLLNHRKHIFLEIDQNRLREISKRFIYLQLIISHFKILITKNFLKDVWSGYHQESRQQTNIPLIKNSFMHNVIWSNACKSSALELIEISMIPNFILNFEFRPSFKKKIFQWSFFDLVVDKNHYRILLFMYMLHSSIFRGWEMVMFSLKPILSTLCSFTYLNFLVFYKTILHMLVSWNTLNIWPPNG